MKHLKRSGQQGIIGYIVVIVAAVVLVAYFRNDLKDLWGSPRVKDALLTAIGWIQTALIWIVGKLGWTSSQIK